MKCRAAVLVVLLAGACGVSGNGSVEVVDHGSVPFGLLDDRAPAPQPAGPGQVELYLVADGSDALHPVARRVDEPSVDAVLAELAAGPTAGEERLGLRSAIAGEGFLAGVDVAGGTATVDLTDDFSSLSGEEQLLAIAQLVLSLTAQPGVGRVAFTLDGNPVEVPRGDGSLTSTSVSRDAYLSLIGSGR